MSYQVIARKWRPQAFEEVTGQDHITRTLRNAIEHDRLHHAYVFSGARGVGKTTTARLFAKALNCHKAGKPNANPCKAGDADICPSCLEITESRSMDVLEIDAASNTGVQNVRDVIVENLNIGPARDRNKIFIIDEVHMLSTPAFNALLKSIEEPPPNVYFVMATTELHKVPDTITSRSQEFVFRTIPQSQIFERLRLIADAEKVHIDDAALQIIARSGEGSMRDAQSNFDQVISFSGEKIGAADVSNALGIAGSEVIEAVIASLGTGEAKAALDVVADLVSRGQDLRVFCREILAVLRDLLMYRVSGGDAGLIESSVLAQEALKLHSERFSEADLIRFFHALAETETRLKDAVQSRYVLEIGLVKLIEMRRVKPLEELIERLAALESQLGQNSAAGAGQQTAAAAAPEKKTLTADAAAETLSSDLVETGSEAGPDEPDLGIGYRPLDEPDATDISDPVPALTEEATKISSVPGFVNSLPVKLPPISSEDLEHVEDKALDALFERKLEWSGDDLLPLKSAGAMAAALLGTPAADRAVSNSNGSAAAPARAPLNIQVPDFSAEDEPVELPVLGDSPTKEELMEYAKAHPLARKAMRIFRAKITDVALRPKEH